MRNTITISINDAQKKDIEYAVKKGAYSSTSEFFRMLVREWKKKQELLSDIHASEKELASGKGKELQSLRDLAGV